MIPMGWMTYRLEADTLVLMHHGVPYKKMYLKVTGFGGGINEQNLEIIGQIGLEDIGTY